MTAQDITTVDLMRQVTGTYDYRLNRDVIAARTECGFVATDYGARSYSQRSCHNAAAWVETYDGVKGNGNRRCNRHRAIDDRTRRNSRYGITTPRQYLPFDAVAEATYDWKQHNAMAEAERLDAIHAKVKVAAQYILNHVKTVGDGGRLDGTTLKVLRQLTDDDTRYTYDVK